MYSITKINYSYWKRLWGECEKTNLLQSWYYGDSKKASEGWQPERWLIKHNDEDIALAQVLLKNYLFFGKIIRLNRGPIIIGKKNHEGVEKISIKVIEKIINNYSKFGLSIIQLAPEIEMNSINEKCLIEFNLKNLGLPNHQSGLINLEKDENEIMMSLNGKWRNCLKKGMRSDMIIKTPKLNKDNLETALSIYKKAKIEKNFRGIPNKILRSMYLINEKSFKTNLFFAYANDKETISSPIGLLISIYHGDTTTYLIAYSDINGRKFNANYVMLWKAILKAKADGCKWFDIGGLNADTPAGIAHFKKGLNSKSYSLIGEWRMLNIIPKIGK